jgi:hypothetical protein
MVVQLENDGEGTSATGHPWEFEFACAYYHGLNLVKEKCIIITKVRVS